MRTLDHLRSVRRRAASLVAAIALAAAYGCPPAFAEAQPESLEYAVKAAYLFKLGAFVEWPDSAFASPSSAVKLCVIGDDPFGRMLDQAVASQKIGEHPIVTERLPAASRRAGCHIAYIAKPDAGSAEAALQNLRGAPVLTVTDSSIEKGARGVVNFVIKDRHVRFQIDSQAASENGLKMSSKLLSLAVPANASS